MLIENIEIQMGVLFKVSGGGITSTTGAEDIKVLNVSTTYSIRGLPSANISIIVEKNKSVVGTQITELKKSDFVGTGIKITWNPGSKYRPMTFFTGIISGIGIVKSSTGVQYSVTCTGGPQAMYNTTISTSPWYPFGDKDPATLSELFNDVLLNESTWKTPKELFKQLMSQIPEASATHFTGKITEAAESHFQLAQAFLEVDRQTLQEPQILQTFFGNVGSNEEFDEPIRERIFQLVTQRGSTATYWDLLNEVATEIGCYIVPWINTTLILPHMLFTNAIRANVFFPTMINSVNLQSDPLDYPDQIIVYAEDDFVTTDVATMSVVLRDHCVVFPKKVDESEFSPYPSKSYKFVPPPAYSPFIRKSAWLKKDFAKKQVDVDESREDYDPAEEATLLQQSSELWKNYCENFAEFQYHKLRSENDVADVNTVFHPVAVPGFSAYILDGETGTNFRGLLLSVSHSISEQSANTSLRLGNLTPIDGSGQNLEIRSPLWLQLLPEGANVGPETLTVGTERDGALSEYGATHVTPDEALEHVAMGGIGEFNAAEQAAFFTSRL